MTIALDIDGTLTRDPEGWRQFVTLFQSRGHRVIIATGRQRHTSDMDRFGIPPDLLVVYCGSVPKRQACLALGIEVEVWIDDMPAMIDGILTCGKDYEL
jgi:hypothetical protein